MKERQWKANKLPVVGCPECIGEGKIFIHNEGEEKQCSNCKGIGTFPANMNKLVTTNKINNQLNNYGDRNKY